MLGLIAAQLKYKVETKALQNGKAVWVDVSGLVYMLTFVGCLC